MGIFSSRNRHNDIFHYIDEDLRKNNIKPDFNLRELNKVNVSNSKRKLLNTPPTVRSQKDNSYKVISLHGGKKKHIRKRNKRKQTVKRKPKRTLKNINKKQKRKTRKR
jgi:hypothetical protein